MGTEKRQRQKEGRQARIAAAEAAKRRSDRRRRYITFVVIAIAVLGVFALINAFTKKDKAKTVAAGTTSSTGTSLLPSAAGKPCVAMTGTPPKGAPSVPVEVGKPPTKLVIKDLKEGTGKAIVAADTTSINYVGVACSTGKIFDSSYSRNAPFVTPLDASAQVIDGWKQGIPGMKIGGERLLGIPASLAYGANPPEGSGIAPDETLWFVVQPVSSVPTTSTTAPPPSSTATTAPASPSSTAAGSAK
jgi:peptidylprolyl isomerase